MIDRKFVLYILLGISCFALWDAWQRDYKEEAIQADKTEIVAEKKEIRRASTARSSKQNQKQTDKIKRAEEVVSSEKIIKVKTDSLEVAIDLVGGNVVRANLPKYPEVIYQKEPTKLLSDKSSAYYITESGLISDQGPDQEDKKAVYKSKKTEYVLFPNQEELKVKLYWNKKGIDVIKTFTFTKGKYLIDVEYEIDNKTNKEFEGQFYAEIKRKKPESQGGLFKFATYTGASTSSEEKPYEKISFSSIEKATKNGQEIIRDNKGGWVAMQQRYFLSVWVPNQKNIYSYFNNERDDIYTIGLSDSDVVVPAGKNKTIGAALYIGPEITDNIKHLAKGLERTVDYGWLWWISIWFFWILKNIYKIVGNWGWAIILITLLIKLVFYKLSETSCRSMAKMRELMPKMKALKERYGDDRQKMHQATMDLYKREKINPLNFGGCLPMLIQIPFFIALYYVLIGAVELRHSPFIFWIHDLSARDPYFILPLLMGASMFLQQRLSPSSPDPSQAKMMMLMPVIFTVFFLNFPSGLVLYWLVSNLLSILQQWYINRKLGIGGEKHKKPRSSK